MSLTKEQMKLLADQKMVLADADFIIDCDQVISESAAAGFYSEKFPYSKLAIIQSHYGPLGFTITPNEALKQVIISWE